MSHEGYTNFETWSIALILDNDRELCTTWRGYAVQIKVEAANIPQVFEGIWTPEQGAIFTVADTLKDQFENQAEDLDLAPPFGDLLSAALSAVNWQEVAEGLLEEI